VEITAENVPDSVAASLNTDGVITSMHSGRLIVDAPDTAPTDGMLDAIRGAGATIVSVIPRRKRLEDLFVETITKPREEAIR